MTPFGDSLDDGGLYTKGICGEKLVSLDPGTPSFLTLAKDLVDPINNDLTLTFDASQASDADIREHTISYTTSSKDFGPSVPEITGTFKF